MSAADEWLITELQRYGATQEGIIQFDGTLGPEHLPHLDLWPAPGTAPLVDAVVEMQRRPVLYAVRGPQTQSQIEALAHVLAQRAAADHMAVVEPGCLTVYPVVQSVKRLAPWRCAVNDTEAATQIPRLTFALDELNARGAAATLHEALVEQLQQSTVRLVQTSGVGHADALSLIGRALFMRFLIDRRVVSATDLSDICPASPELVSCMATPERASMTFEWLDNTFNGDLLPLVAQGRAPFWRALGPAAKTVCDELSRILMKLDASGQRSFEWATLDFSHIPVGLLSQVYEHYCHEFLPQQASAQSVHYTPRSIAEYMVGEVFFRVEEPHAARVLDPSVGAGVFLVAAFRALITARWKEKRTRPDTQTIREILYDQLRGFDVNEAALKLTALSLYLTALELDPAPRPLSALKFDNLRNSVLFDVRSAGDRLREKVGLPVVGSLGSHMSEEHRKRYDLVIGNPPWTAWERPERGAASIDLDRVGVASAAKSNPPTGDAAVDLARRENTRAFDVVVQEVVGVVREIMHARLGDVDDTFDLVDLTPDVPFFWRALDWAKPGGQVALALHARLLFKQSEVGTKAREALFRGARITGILNGSALRETKVWPKVKAPFCLVFAVNDPPGPLDSFTFASPLVDARLNRRGHLRIDANAAHEVSWQDVVSTPPLLKSLFRGTDLDVAIVERLRRVEGVPLGEYWRPEHELHHGQGYRLGGERSHQQLANRLACLPDVTAGYAGALLIDPEGLATFRRTTAAFPRDRQIYRAPVILVKQSPGADRNNGRALFSWCDVAYSESFYGFSAAGHPQGSLMARYLLLVMSSDLFLYWALMQSGKFGVERPVFQKSDLEQFPIRPLEALSGEDRDAVVRLSEALLSERERPWAAIDDWLAKIHGLNRWDAGTMRDTLAVSLPWEDAQITAQRPPTPEEIADFARHVAAYLTQLVNRPQRRITVDIARASAHEPWAFLRVRSVAVDSPPLTPSPLVARDLAAFIDEAECHGATRIVHVDGRPGVLTVGILAQYRYWTPSRAQLLSLDLVRRQEATLTGGRPA